jgi:FMN-dependent NADH-azoreductase
MKVLRIDASIKPQGSVSLQLTDDIIAKLGATDVKTRKTAGIPSIDGAWLGAVFTPAENRTADQKPIADLSDALIDEIKSADVVVIGVPVYNFNIAAGLKNWIDQIVRAGVTFKYTETGPVGLLPNKRTILAFSSDGTAAGSDIDFAQRYMKHILGFVGITDVTTVTAQQMAFNKDAAMKTAADQIAALA